MTTADRFLIGLFLAASPVVAQSGQVESTSGSISGVVREARTRSPIAHTALSVVTSARSGQGGAILGTDSKRFSATTDDQGRYSFAHLPLGRHLVFGLIRNRPVSRPVTLSLGQPDASVDFDVIPGGSISGIVVDEDGEPVPSAGILLIAREYRSGSLVYVVKSSTMTDDRGEYHLEHAEPGREYLVAAQPGLPDDGVRSAARGPEKRKPTLAPAYYPNATAIEGASRVEAPRDGGNLEGIDIRMPRLPSYCIRGTLEAKGLPAALSYSIEDRAVSGRTSIRLGGEAGPDGKIVICGMRPGEYRLSAMRQPDVNHGPLLGSITVIVTDKDVRDVRVLARAGLPVTCRFVWDGEAPAEPAPARATISLLPLDRDTFFGEVLSARTSIPGEFHFRDLLPGDYSATGVTSSSGLYIKDISYGGASVLHQPLRFGSAAIGSEIRVLVGRDGSSINAAVTDKNGNPVPYANVACMPASAGSELDLAAGLVWGQADQQGGYESGTLAPGKYYILATEAPISMTYEDVHRLWKARSQAAEVELATGQTLHVTLGPARLD